MKISVIRPPLVYGAGAKSNFALLTRAVNLGVPLPFAAIHNHRAFLAVQNLSSFIGLADDCLIGSLELNVSKAIGTGWQPDVSLDEGLRLALAAQDA